MQTSIYLARLIGPALAVVGLSMLMQPEAFLALAAEMLKSPALLYFAAVAGLLGGIAIVLAHNLWVADWRVIITLLGWMSIVDSAFWIVITRPYRDFWAPFLTSSAVSLAGGAIVLLLGAVLSYYGYAAKPAARRRR